MKLSTTFSSLKFKNYRLFWFGSLFSEVGSQMQVVAISWQVYELTHSAFSLGIVGLSGFIPILLFSLIAGVTADKVDRKNLLILTQIFQAFLAAFLALASFYNFITPNLIYLTIFLATAIKTFQAPSRQALVPHLVPRSYFVNAVSLNTILRQASLVIGPAIAGFMIEYFRVQSIYIVNALSFFILIFALIPIKVKAKPLESKVTYSLKSILEGIRFVKGNQILSSTMLLDFLANFFSSAMTLLPIFAKDVLKVGAQGLGILYAAPAIGAVLSGLFLASFLHVRHQGRLILYSVALYGLATLGFGLSKNFYLSFFFLFLVGVGDMISTVYRNTIRQLITPDYIRGRMVSINMIFVQGGPLIGEAEAGFVAYLTTAPFSVATGGIATVLITILIAYAYPRLRKYHGEVVKY